MKKVLVPMLFVLALALACGSAAWADITDPADLHVGPGAGTSCATGCGADPNTIGTTGWDVYYNPNQNSSQSPIGNPLFLIVAVPDYTGSSNSPSVNGTATMYTPYPGGATSTVSVTNATDQGTMTSAKPNNIYDFLAAQLGITVTNVNNSFNFVNMVGCDTGAAGCPNSGLLGSGAPLFGKTITGFDIWTWNVGTTNFSPQDLLDFTGNLPIGSYVAAFGIDASGTEAWAVPFTESGLVTHVPEPGSLTFLGAGLLGVALLAGRRVLTA